MNTFYLGLIVVVYLLSLSFLGYLGYKKTTSASDYLVGGRNMNPIVMSLSYGATFISASAIVGFGGAAAAYGMGLQWLCLLNMFMGVIIAFIIFGRPTRRLGVRYNATTFPQLMGRCFHSKTIQVLAGAVIFLGMPLYAAVVLKGGAVFIEQMFNIDFNVALLVFTLVIAAYVIAGGMKGVMYTDAMQAGIMFVCMLFLIFKLYSSLDMGFTEANVALGEMGHLIPEKFKELGHEGWTSMPRTGSAQWYSLVTSLILGVGIGCLAQPQLVVRFMTVESTRQLNRGVFIGCFFLVVTVGVIYHAGALSNLFFYNTEGKIATEVVADIDKIIPYFIDKSMPAWFSALFMLCILSASMSTMSALFHTMGAAAGADIYAPLTNKKRSATKVIRFCVFIAIIVSYVICYTLPMNIIARGTSIFMGVCASTFLPAYFCALYWKKVNRNAAVASMWTGLLVSLFVLGFMHKAEAAPLGICKAIFGRDVLVDIFPYYAIDPILYALPFSALVIVAVTLWPRKKSA
ncbi:MAG: sodium:solute symporter family protein [Bacteroidaceae bacterium]|nr:sodium:solute symporter family protein [Bacteroidaceae bacterium]